MSCNHCSIKFNFFHKEMGCASCSLSFCNKCLKQKCRIPSKGPGEYAVCRVCYAKITSGHSSIQGPFQPPDALIKRFEALENIPQQSTAVRKNEKSHLMGTSGLSPVDQRLLERLENLKDKGTGAPPTEAELRKRLAKLKGENNYVEGPSKQILTTDTRTDEQKVDDYLEMFANERDIELAHNPQEEIEARLASLRGKGVRPNEGSFVSNLHDSSSSSEEEVDRLTKKIMDEVALDKKYALKLSCPENEEEYEEELPWCVICNRDAKYKCIDCGGDLYCEKCNAEFHSNWEGSAHGIISYTPK